MASDANAWRDLLSHGRAPKLTLIVLRVWLNAADALVTSTIMPSVGRALGALMGCGFGLSLLPDEPPPHSRGSNQ